MNTEDNRKIKISHEINTIDGSIHSDIYHITLENSTYNSMNLTPKQFEDLRVKLLLFKE